MTISTQSSSIVVAATGAISYAWPFVGVSATDIIVSYTPVNGVIAIVQSNLYTVSLNAPATGQIWGMGGTISPITPSNYATGTLTIQRLLPLTQEAEISNQGNQYPIVTEEALDTLCMEIQQVSARTNAYRGVWSSGIVYNVGDYVLDGMNGANTENYYMCVIANTSVTWSSDLGAGDWVLTFNFSSATNSAASAAASATAASTSATAASTSASTSTTQAGIATTQSGIATTEAVAALASANSAAASAASASASAASITDVSTTSNTIGTGAKTFTVSAGKSFAAGMYLLVTDQANSSNYMHGSVTSYSGTTLVMNIIDDGGSGTKTAWNITPSLPSLTTAAAGTSGQIQYNNSGILGGVSTTGTGNVVLATNPTVSAITVSGNETVGGTLGVTGAVTLSNLTASELVATNGSKVLVNITALPTGTTAVTQSANDDSTNVATTAYVDTNKTPIPTSSTGLGQIVIINFQGSYTYTVPSGGSWLVMGMPYNSGSGAVATTVGIQSFGLFAGGTTITTGSGSSQSFQGIAWRVS